MNDDYIDIYGDLEQLDYQQKFEELQQVNEDLHKRHIKTLENLRMVLVENEELKTKNRNLYNNHNSLLSTARAEINRKDKMIKDLRKQISETKVSSNKDKTKGTHAYTSYNNSNRVSNHDHGKSLKTNYNAKNIKRKCDEDNEERHYKRRRSNEDDNKSRNTLSRQKKETNYNQNERNTKSNDDNRKNLHNSEKSCKIKETKSDNYKMDKSHSNKKESLTSNNSNKKIEIKAEKFENKRKEQISKAGSISKQKFTTLKKVVLKELNNEKANKINQTKNNEKIDTKKFYENAIIDDLISSSYDSNERENSISQDNTKIAKFENKSHLQETFSDINENSTKNVTNYEINGYKSNFINNSDVNKAFTESSESACIETDKNSDKKQILIETDLPVKEEIKLNLSNEIIDLQKDLSPKIEKNLELKTDKNTSEYIKNLKEPLEHNENLDITNCMNKNKTILNIDSTEIEKSKKVDSEPQIIIKKSIEQNKKHTELNNKDLKKILRNVNKTPLSIEIVNPNILKIVSENEETKISDSSIQLVPKLSEIIEDKIDNLDLLQLKSNENDKNSSVSDSHKSCADKLDNAYESSCRLYTHKKPKKISIKSNSSTIETLDSISKTLSSSDTTKNLDLNCEDTSIHISKEKQKDISSKLYSNSNQNLDSNSESLSRSKSPKKQKISPKSKSTNVEKLDNSYETSCKTNFSEKQKKITFEPDSTNIETSDSINKTSVFSLNSNKNRTEISIENSTISNSQEKNKENSSELISITDKNLESKTILEKTQKTSSKSNATIAEKKDSKYEDCSKLNSFEKKVKGSPMINTDDMESTQKYSPKSTNVTVEKLENSYENSIESKSHERLKEISPNETAPVNLDLSSALNLTKDKFSKSTLRKSNSPIAEKLVKSNDGSSESKSQTRQRKTSEKPNLAVVENLNSDNGSDSRLSNFEKTTQNSSKLNSTISKDLVLVNESSTTFISLKSNSPATENLEKSKNDSSESKSQTRTKKTSQKFTNSSVAENLDSDSRNSSKSSCLENLMDTSSNIFSTTTEELDSTNEKTSQSTSYESNSSSVKKRNYSRSKSQNTKRKISLGLKSSTSENLDNNYEKSSKLKSNKNLKEKPLKSPKKICKSTKWKKSLSKEKLIGHKIEGFEPESINTSRELKEALFQDALSTKSDCALGILFDNKNNFNKTDEEKSININEKITYLNSNNKINVSETTKIKDIEKISDKNETNIKSLNIKTINFSENNKKEEKSNSEQQQNDIIVENNISKKLKNSRNKSIKVSKELSSICDNKKVFNDTITSNILDDSNEFFQTFLNECLSDKDVNLDTNISPNKDILDTLTDLNTSTLKNITNTLKLNMTDENLNNELIDEHNDNISAELAMLDNQNNEKNNLDTKREIIKIVKSIKNDSNKVIDNINLSNDNILTKNESKIPEDVNRNQQSQQNVKILSNLNTETENLSTDKNDLNSITNDLNSSENSLNKSSNKVIMEMSTSTYVIETVSDTLTNIYVTRKKRKRLSK